MADAVTTSPSSTAAGRIREAVAVFDDPAALQRAVDDLTIAGFERRELSLMAGDATLKERLGYVPPDIDALKHDPAIPRQSYVAPEDEGNAQGVAIGVPAYVGAVLASGAVLATGGTALAAAAVAAAAGVGAGALGGVLASWFSDKRSEPLRQHMDKGGILLWVHLADAGHEERALAILARHTPHPVEVHEVPQTV